jgi:hypothetical protein
MNSTEMIDLTNDDDEERQSEFEEEEEEASDVEEIGSETDYDSDWSTSVDMDEEMEEGCIWNANGPVSPAI